MHITDEKAKEVINNLLYFDIHGHREKLLPPLLRLLSPGKFPRDVKVAELKGTGVNGFIICAVGDPNSFKIIKTDPFKYVIKKLNEIKRTISLADGVIAATSDEIEKAAAEGKKVFVLGIEGGDFIAEDLTRLSAVYNEGVRVIVPMHYKKNSIGSISFGWGGRIVPEEEQTGLTAFGKEFIKYADELGMIIDLAHADEKTISDTVKITTKPVICSHTGPRALQDFPRYLSDESLKAVAGTGGLIGMWPFLNGEDGVKNKDDFIKYARYITDLVGVEHLSIGTDINGVPGNMEGYENLNDAWSIIQTLNKAGYNSDEVKMIAGVNFLSLFRKISNTDI